MSEIETRCGTENASHDANGKISHGMYVIKMLKIRIRMMFLIDIEDVRAE
jgi:hypothetical protein